MATKEIHKCPWCYQEVEIDSTKGVKVPKYLGLTCPECGKVFYKAIPLTEDEQAEYLQTLRRMEILCPQSLLY